jgi:hypothetical protein
LLLLILAILISPLLLFFLPLILHLGPETANAAATTHRAIVSKQAAVRRRERSPPQ